MNTTLATIRPSPLASPMLGFLARVRAGERYAICPLGNYSRACLDGLSPEVFESDDRRLLGFIDDHPAERTFAGRPVLPMHVAAQHWRIDAMILTRDTHAAAIRNKFNMLRDEGLLASARLIDHPAPTIAAMSAHLGTYHPTCRYDAAFVQSLRSRQPEIECTGSSLICTMDAEAFPVKDDASSRLYGEVMREICSRMADAGFGFSLCVQLRDSQGGMRRTPDDVVHAVLERFGPEAIELHGLDHDMPVEGYAVEWFEQALEELRSRFGAECRYWAPPGWNLNWRSLQSLQSVNQIEAVRGIWSGPNCRRPHAVQTLREPYRVEGLWQLPYSYVDWMFMDMWGKRLDNETLIADHERLAEFAASAPCMVETVVHPFRFVGTDYRERLELFGRTLKTYQHYGVEIVSVASALNKMRENSVC
jgi:hypothetical protein